MGSQVGLKLLDSLLEKALLDEVVFHKLLEKHCTAAIIVQLVEDLLCNNSIDATLGPLDLEELPNFIESDAAILADVDFCKLQPQLVDDSFILSLLLQSLCAHLWCDLLEHHLIRVIYIASLLEGVAMQTHGLPNSRVAHANCL